MHPDRKKYVKVVFDKSSECFGIVPASKPVSSFSYEEYLKEMRSSKAIPSCQASPTVVCQALSSSSSSSNTLLSVASKARDFVAKRSNYDSSGEACSQNSAKKHKLLSSLFSSQEKGNALVLVPDPVLQPVRTSLSEEFALGPALQLDGQFLSTLVPQST